MATDFSYTNRIVPRPYYNQDLTWALRNEIHDPFWTLLRQKELGEFQAFDGGALIKATVQYTYAEPHTLVPKVRDENMPNGIPINNSLPLETQIQHQPYWKLDISALAEFSNRLLLLFPKYGISQGKDILAKLILNFPISYSALDDRIDSINEETALIETRQRLKKKLVKWKDKIFDVRALFKQFPTPKDDKLFAEYLMGILAGDDKAYEALFVEYHKQAKDAGLVGFQNSFWDEQQQAYNFGLNVQIEESNKQVKMSAPEYSFGDIDWYHLDGSDKDIGGYNFEHDDHFGTGERTYIPSVVNFFGRPANRWWQFEDHQVNFDGIKPKSTADTSVLAIQQFSLFYSNDWFLLPLSIPLNSLFSVSSVVVEDHFGVEFEIRPHGARDRVSNGSHGGAMPWSIFEPATDIKDSEGINAIYAAGSKAFKIESAPLEEVLFQKDEVGNLLYGIETIVPDGFGGSINGNDLNLSISDFFKSHLPIIPPLNPTESDNPKFDFSLGSQVPENWIPFLAQSKNGKGYFQRGKFPRNLEGHYMPDRQFVRPKTSVLNPSSAIVPQEAMLIDMGRINSGIKIGLKWQRLRWKNGKIVYWLSKYNKFGSGQDVSNAQAFDLLTRTTEAPSIEASEGPKFALEWVPSRVAHFSADKIVPPQDGASVTYWMSNLQGNPDFNASGSSAATFRASGIGQHPTVEVTNQMQFGIGGNFNSSDWTFVIVFRGSYSAGPSRLLSLRAGTASQTSDLVIGYGLNTAIPNSKLAVQLPSGILYESFYSAPTSPALLTLRVKNFRAGESTEQMLDLNLNGFNAGAMMHIGSGPEVLPSLPSFEHLVLGDQSQGVNGLVSEILVFNRSLSNRELLNTERFLKSKYGL